MVCLENSKMSVTCISWIFGLGLRSGLGLGRNSAGGEKGHFAALLHANQHLWGKAVTFCGSCVSKHILARQDTAQRGAARPWLTRRWCELKSLPLERECASDKSDHVALFPGALHSWSCLTELLAPSPSGVRSPNNTVSEKGSLCRGMGKRALCTSGDSVAWHFFPWESGSIRGSQTLWCVIAQCHTRSHFPESVVAYY